MILGSGKTRFLNTIFNLGSDVFRGNLSGVNERNLTLRINDDVYRWDIATELEKDKIVVKSENLYKNDKPIVTRTKNKFDFNGDELPKLRKDQFSLTILKEEDLIKPLFEGFKNS